MITMVTTANKDKAHITATVINAQPKVIPFDGVAVALTCIYIKDRNYIILKI